MAGLADDVLQGQKPRPTQQQIMDSLMAQMPMTPKHPYAQLYGAGTTEAGHGPAFLQRKEMISRAARKARTRKRLIRQVDTVDTWQRPIQESVGQQGNGKRGGMPLEDQLFGPSPHNRHGLNHGLSTTQQQEALPELVSLPMLSY